MGVTQQAVHKLERHDSDPKPSTVRRYANAVGAVVEVGGGVGVAGSGFPCRSVDWRAASGRRLIRYEDLHEAGILRWIALRGEFSRALDPVISSVDLRSATPNTSGGSPFRTTWLKSSGLMAQMFKFLHSNL